MADRKKPTEDHWTYDLWAESQLIAHALRGKGGPRLAEALAIRLLVHMEHQCAKQRMILTSGDSDG